MTLIQAIILGIVQGITEFLPISSSAHLVLVPHIFGWKEFLSQNSSNMSFDIFLHFGSLIALLIYFRQDLSRLALERNKKNNKLLLYIFIATIPAVIAAVLFGDFFESLFNSASKTSMLLIVTGLIIFSAEYFASLKRDLSKIKLKDSILIGITQAFAIAPGISRSGSTISAGMILGLSREAAARFSFLIAIPVVFGAFVYTLLKTKFVFDYLFLIGFLASFISSYFAISFMLSYIQKGNLKIFAMYCIIVGSIGALLL